MQPRRYLLDTQIPIKLSKRGGFEEMPEKVQRILQSPQAELHLSIISDMEIAIKHSVGKLNFPPHELAVVCINAGIERFFPLQEHHTLKLFDLPLHHRDPFDRALISTALAEDLPIISSDESFSMYKGLEVIW